MYLGSSFCACFLDVFYLSLSLLTCFPELPHFSASGLSLLVHNTLVLTQESHLPDAHYFFFLVLKLFLSGQGFVGESLAYQKKKNLGRLKIPLAHYISYVGSSSNREH